MKFPRSKKLIFVNNKGGVGKTTLAFNCTVAFAKQGYKTALIDLDPQCNLTRRAMGEAYNVYGKQPIADHRAWMEKMPERVRTFLSEKHCRNGLVAESWKTPLQIIQDYGRIPAKCQELSVAIFEKSKEEFAHLSGAILKVLAAY